MATSGYQCLSRSRLDLFWFAPTTVSSLTGLTVTVLGWGGQTSRNPNRDSDLSAVTVSSVEVVPALVM